jgi:hypothetical protein
MNIVETCYEILVLSYCKKKLLLKEVVLGPGTAALQTFKMFIASGWRGWCCKFEVLGMKSSVRDLEFRSFCLDVNFEAVLFLASKFITSCLETRLFFSFISAPVSARWRHAA